MTPMSLFGRPETRDMRRSDRIAMGVVLVTIVIVLICVGSVVSGQDRGQSQDHINGVQEQRTRDIDARVAAIEKLDISAHLAVLDQKTEDFAEIRKWFYYVMTGIAGTLIAQGFQIASNRPRRTHTSGEVDTIYRPPEFR